MKYFLVMIPNQPILVSDEDIKEDDKIFFDSKILTTEYFDSHFLKWEFKDFSIPPVEYQKYKKPLKIMAGIPELPKIDFSILSEEDCKKIGWVDANKLAYDWLYEETTEEKAKQGYPLKPMEYGFINGFETAQSLNKKKFSLEDAEEIAYQSAQYGMWYALNSQHNNEVPKGNVLQWFQYKFFQPKVFDVEVETYMNGNPHSYHVEPEITNNSIKIIKVL